MSFLRLEKLTKIFGKGKNKVIAIDNLTIEVKEGEFAALLGPSGCGKTTTLRCIAGLEKPTNGRIYIGEEDVSELPPHKRDIGMVFQFPAVYDSVTVFENIALPLYAKKLSKNDVYRKVREVAERFDLLDVLEKKPNKLDISLRQRMVLARAIAKEPRLLLLDEPLTPLDPVSRVKMRSDLKRIQKDIKSTIVYVTHDQTEAMSLADKIAIMDKGELIQYDTPENIYLKPANTFVSFFVGEPGMNLIDANIFYKEGGQFIRIGQYVFKINLTLDKPLEGEIIFGIRPEHISISMGGKGMVQGNVIMSEIIGGRSIQHVDVSGVLIKVKVPEPLQLSGKVVWLEFQKDMIRLFNKKTGQLIC